MFILNSNKKKQKKKQQHRDERQEQSGQPLLKNYFFFFFHFKTIIVNKLQAMPSIRPCFMDFWIETTLCYELICFIFLLLFTCQKSSLKCVRVFSASYELRSIIEYFNIFIIYVVTSRISRKLLWNY